MDSAIPTFRREVLTNSDFPTSQFRHFHSYSAAFSYISIPTPYFLRQIPFSDDLSDRKKAISDAPKNPAPLVDDAGNFKGMLFYSDLKTTKLHMGN